MSIATEIQRLAQAKADIKTAIENKGVTVGDGTIDTFASKISEITGGGGGGIPTGYHSVTFMNGDNVLFERLVLSGDDCPDPLTQGRIETPTKESTPQYNYTHSGWTSVDGGMADSNVLKNITEDKVVYSAYTESVRTYTVTFYDEDGTTVLNTEQVAYGGTATYTPPKKDNYMFVGWTPEPTNITGNLECVGAWQESYSFAAASWEYIAQLAESGQASKAFSVGDTRTETIDGSNFTLEIIGFDHDTITDTGELAGITIWIKDYTKTLVTTSAVKSTWYDNLHTTYEIPIFNLLSSELQSVIKSVTKEYIEAPNGYSERTCTAKIWSLSAAEIGVERGKSNVEEGTIYEKFANYPSKTYNNSSYTYSDIKTGKRYWLRSFYWQSAPMNVSAAGGLGHATTYNSQSYVCPCFCV
ncbi:MAG: InlB B-repeat-containing protein [Clostridia bacterium]|nr:InlB B-repeat-containing protein [Clostridia bacterium]